MIREKAVVRIGHCLVVVYEGRKEVLSKVACNAVPAMGTTQ